MLIFFQKYHKQVNLLLLTLFGLSCGLLAGTLLESAIDQVPEREELDTSLPAQEALDLTTADLNLILQRNIFDPEGRSTATFELQAGQGDAAETESGSPPQDMSLLGTVVAGDNSLALINTGRELDVYRLGDSLPGDGTVEDIQRNLVNIRNRDSSISTLEILDDSAGAPLASRAPESTSAESPEVRQVGENRWLIPAETAERTRQNLAEELRLAQMQPRIVDGQTNGFLIRMIRRNSILNKLGMRRGDVILSVNDMSLDSPEKALQVFQQLREARQIVVAVERQGEAMTFAYELD